SMGLGAAASTFVGQNVGAGKIARARRAGWLAAFCALGFVGVGSNFLFAWAESIAGLFAPNDDAVALRAAEDLRCTSPTYRFAAFVTVLALGLNGAGSARVRALLDGLVYGLLAVAGGCLLLLGLVADRIWRWLSSAGASLGLAGVYAAWFRAGKLAAIGL